MALRDRLAQRETRAHALEFGFAVHALEQKDYGHKNFPFFRVELENDPGPAQMASPTV